MQCAATATPEAEWSRFCTTFELLMRHHQVDMRAESDSCTGLKHIERIIRDLAEVYPALVLGSLAVRYSVAANAGCTIASADPTHVVELAGIDYAVTPLTC